MRTLKKVLALTVVLATLFSLTAFAGYTDEDQINEKLVEDVNLMGALNVMKGDTEGTFRPNATISRAEAAKMIYVVRNGGVDDKAAGWTNMKTFSDVPSGIWYEGYVNYCASLGIIAGVGNGKFNPDGAVTGVELAKMLLVVAGYKPDVQGYTGPAWSVNVINDAQLAGLFDDYAVAFSASAPRQWAAKLFANAILKAEMAVYFNGELINGVGIIGTKNVTVGQKYFGLQVDTGVLVGNYNVKQEGAFSGKYSTIAVKKDDKTNMVKVKYDAPAELLQQEVTFVADAKTGAVYSVYATGTSKVYNVIFSDITFKAVGSKKENLSIAFEGFAAAVHKANADNDSKLDINIYPNFDLDNAAQFTTKNVTDLVDSLKEDGLKGNAALRVVDTDGDGLIDAVFATLPTYGMVKEFDAAKNTFKLVDAKGNAVMSFDAEGKPTINHSFTKNADKFAAYNFVDTVKKDDIVKITTDNTGASTTYKVEVLKAVTGTMTARKNDYNATIGGTAYTFGFLSMADSVMPTLSVDKELSVYTDNGAVVYVGGGSTAATQISANIAYVIQKATVMDEWNKPVNKIQLLLADGTVKAFVYAAKPKTMNDNVYYTFAQVMEKEVYEYALSGDNGVYLRDWSYQEQGKVAYDETVSDKFSTTTRRFGSYLTNDASYFFLVDHANNKYSVVKASELKNQATLESGKTTYTINGLKTIAFGVVKDAGANTGDALYAFCKSGAYDSVVNGKLVTAVDVMLSTGEEKTLVINSGEEQAVKGNLMKVTPVDNKYNLEEHDLTSGKLQGFNASVLSVNNQLYNITSDTMFFYLSKDGKSMVDEFSLDDAASVAFAFNSKNNNLTVVYVVSAE